MATRRGMLSLIGLAPAAGALASLRGAPLPAGVLGQVRRMGVGRAATYGARMQGLPITAQSIAGTSIRAGSIRVGTPENGLFRSLLASGSQEPCFSSHDLEAVGALSLGG